MLQVYEDFLEHGIDIYPFHGDEDDEEDALAKQTLRDQMPFAVVGSRSEVTVAGKSVVGRQPVYGLVEVENKLHSDFGALRDMLLRTHTQDLIDATHARHYARFRTALLLKTLP